MSVHGLNAYYDRFLAVADLDLEIERGLITAFIGPSGCGKSTVLRALNRLHEVPPRRRVEGTVLLDDLDIYDPRLDVNQVRRRIGMVFQQPNPFPTMSIRDNAIAGLRLAERRPPKHVLDEAAESALRRANLWDEVKDRLHEPGVSLSGGQQQRLCIARAIAVDPDVLLMDEPASALDPLSTYAIEDLMQSLKKDVTIVVVTHNMEQAARVSDITAFFSISGEGQPGRLVEVAPTELLFTNPARPRTEDYITGRFG